MPEIVVFCFVLLQNVVTFVGPMSEDVMTFSWASPSRVPLWVSADFDCPSFPTSVMFAVTMAPERAALRSSQSCSLLLCASPSEVCDWKGS